MNDKIKEAVASYMKDRYQRHALAELITEYIDPNHVTTDFVSMLLKTRNLNKGDSLVKKVRKGIRVWSWVPGTTTFASHITLSERINYALDYMSVKVAASEWDLENGNIGTVEDIRREMNANLRDTVQARVFSALASIWDGTNTPSNYTSVGGALTATALETAINRVVDVTGGVMAVVGVRNLMNPITKFGAFVDNGAVSPTYEGVPSQMQQVVDNGFLGKYYGANLIYLNQVYNNPEDHTALLPSDKVLVIGMAAGEFCTYGDAQWKEYTDPRPTPSEWVVEETLQTGMMIDNAEAVYILDDVTA